MNQVYSSHSGLLCLLPIHYHACVWWRQTLIGKSRLEIHKSYFLFHSGAKFSARPHLCNNSNVCFGFKLQIPWLMGAASLLFAARVSWRTAHPFSFILTPRRPLAIRKDPAKKFSTVYTRITNGIVFKMMESDEDILWKRLYYQGRSASFPLHSQTWLSSLYEYACVTPSCSL